jgi:WD40 repeat protein
VTAAAFSPDGRSIITVSSDHTARIWNSETGEPVGIPLVHEGRVHEAAFSRDGRRLMTASDDGAARIWNAATGELLVPPLEHRETVNTAIFSLDGRRVVTASNDDTARVWETATGSPVTPRFDTATCRTKNGSNASAILRTDAAERARVEVMTRRFLDGQR